LRGLIVDYGGVLTTPLTDTLGHFCAELDLDEATLGAAIKGLLDGTGDGPAPIHALETGELDLAEFERRLAASLTTKAGDPVEGTGLVNRMFSGFNREASMTDVVRTLRRRGVRTALCSNSWGTEAYPRDDFGELFDVVVISGEVGMRKPNADIYELTSARLGLAPAACVFVDDLAVNVRGAAAVGMCGIHHTDPATTLAELAALFGLPLDTAAG
jgi:epoxide hydrolase-like predicted phosphatase